MNILILGGTIFLGQHLVKAALAGGHQVSLFNRGQHQPAGLEQDLNQVEQLRGDRDGKMEVLQGRKWDAVIDTSGYLPRIVGSSAQLLAGSTDHYTFISSISVYPDFSKVWQDESSPVGKLADESVEQVNGETYGPLKALCEQMVVKHFPDKTLIIRPGLIVGPHDPTDRFTYWPRRVSKGDEVLAPGRSERVISFIDVRDLADWTIRMVEQRKTGCFNANGPDYELSMETLLNTCQEVSGSDARFSWVSEEYLLDEGVGPWMELPMWMPESNPEYAGFFKVSCDKAVSEGLTYRPVADTVRATLEWDRSRPAGIEYRAGLNPDREKQLLVKWQAGKQH